MTDVRSDYLLTSVISNDNIHSKTYTHMARYRLRKKKTRLNPGADGLWYAEPAPGRVADAADVCRLATQNLTLSPIELRMGLDALAASLPSLLASGATVRLGDMGTLRLEYGSSGAASPEEFHYRLIRRPRVVFRPSRRFAAAVTRAVSFEMEGLTDGGVAFASIADYRRWQAQGGGADTSGSREKTLSLPPETQVENP